MKNIEKLRQEIRETDQLMAELFQRRMEIVKDVAACKKELGLPVKDERQEKKVLETNASFIEDEEIRPYYLLFMQDVMNISCQYQEHLIRE